MKNTVKRIQLDHAKLLGFRKVKCENKNNLKPLTVAMVGNTKSGVSKPPA